MNVENLVKCNYEITDIKKFIKQYGDWYMFYYTSGANPYIACTDKVKLRMLTKYNGKFSLVTTTPCVSFTINDKEESEVF